MHRIRHRRGFQMYSEQVAFRKMGLPRFWEQLGFPMVLLPITKLPASKIMMSPKTRTCWIPHLSSKFGIGKYVHSFLQYSSRTHAKQPRYDRICHCGLGQGANRSKAVSTVRWNSCSCVGFTTNRTVESFLLRK